MRLFPGSFAMVISGTQRKRDKLAVQIPRLAGQAEIPEGDERSFPRLTAEDEALLVLPDGTSALAVLLVVADTDLALLQEALP